MRHTLRKIFTLIALGLLTSSVSHEAFSQTPTDTIYNPTVIYSSLPHTYEIKGITVSGVNNYDEEQVMAFSGLAPGQRLTIPGPDITNAVKRIMRQGVFQQARIKLAKVYGNQAWLEIELKSQPRISKVEYKGMKKSERTDLAEKLQLQPGQAITPNIIDRIKLISNNFFKVKGFQNAETAVKLAEDHSRPGEMIATIEVNKHEKMKVHKIYIDGNEVLSDGKIKRTMKKTNENGNIFNLFKQKKFVESDFQDDLNRILEKYNEKGYRDAKIVKDSIARYNNKLVDVYITLDEGDKYYIKDIEWVGNTIYATEVLNAGLGMAAGDVYNQKLMNKRLTEDEDAISSLYQDNGYLFFNVVPIERDVEGDSVSLEMRVTEGPQARINNVVINGNDRLYEKVIRRELRVKPGELFSKSDIMRSLREIAQTGHFNPENMVPDVQPDEESGTVDIAFNLESKASDQIEFSLGWGQTGVIGKVSLKFTNFSIKNLLYPSTYRGIIPQGEGQTFTLSAQTNARYFQAYSISFLDPWFGGKRPNSLQVSAMYSRQTGVNSSYYNSRWQNSAYGWNSYYPGYNYGTAYSDYYQNSYQASYDPNQVLQLVNLNVGFGKRLKWPDDYFTFTAELGYTWYYLKNWEYLYYMNNGTSNALVLGLTLSRSSLDNPLYTRSGSEFSLSLQMTPPASLMSGKKDWKKLAQTNTTESKKELYRWIEYWKLRFRSRTYTPLINVNTTYTPVLMTRFDFGLLGSYNKWLKSPFETFYVGGDGMSGSYSYATETIALRGYENGQFTPWTREGYAYTRMGLELHFPVLLQQSTTIYALTFLEAGNAWTSVKEFNPFSLKRSAGVGVRLFLPMVGMMGIDWAYGFDKVFNQKGGSHFHFVLGQEF